jgi:hypothetical protein
MFADPTINLVGDARIYKPIGNEDSNGKKRRQADIRTWFNRATMRQRLLADGVPPSTIMAEQYGWVFSWCRELAKEQNKAFYITPLGDEDRMKALENWTEMDSRRQEDVWENNITDAMCSGKPPKHPPLKVMTLHEYDTVMKDRPEKAGIMLSTGRFWQIGMAKEEALRPIPLSTTALVRQLAQRYIPSELKCCHGATKRTVTQGARTDPGEGTSRIAPPVINLEDTIAPLVEQIIAGQEKIKKTRSH